MQTILIVEDQDEVQQLLGLTLRKQGRRMLHAFDAEQGIEVALNERPDLILLDIMMPGGRDGLDLLRAVRNQPETARIKVIVLSAKAQERDKRVAFDAGADDYLVKPFHLVDLKEMVERHLLS